MANSSSALAAAIKAKRLAALGGAVKDGPELDADCQAIAEAVAEHLAGVVVTFPSTTIVVVGSATTQSNPQPVTGGTLG